MKADPDIQNSMTAENQAEITAPRIPTKMAVVALRARRTGLVTSPTVVVSVVVSAPAVDGLKKYVTPAVNPVKIERMLPASWYSKLLASTTPTTMPSTSELSSESACDLRHLFVGSPVMLPKRIQSPTAKPCVDCATGIPPCNVSTAPVGEVRVVVPAEIAAAPPVVPVTSICRLRALTVTPTKPVDES